MHVLLTFGMFGQFIRGFVPLFFAVPVQLSQLPCILNNMFVFVSQIKARLVPEWAWTHFISGVMGWWLINMMITEPTFVENIIDLAFSILCNSYNISMCIYTHRVSFQSEILCHIQVNNKYFNMNYCTFCACVKMERQLGDDSWPYRHRC